MELKKSENEISQLFNDEGIKNDQVKIDELNHKFSQIIYVLYNLDQEINKLKEQFKNLDNGNQEYEKLEKELKSSNIETYNDYYNQIKPFLEKQKKANVKKPDIKEKTIKINNSLLFYIKMCYENFEKSKGFFSSYIIHISKFMK